MAIVDKALIADLLLSVLQFLIALTGITMFETVMERPIQGESRDIPDTTKAEIEERQKVFGFVFVGHV